MLDIYLNILNEGWRELKFAFDGLADDHVWKRPAEGLLSVGELGGHIAHWEAVRLAGELAKPWPDLTLCRIKSPLIHEHFRYYPLTLAGTPAPEHLAMTAAEVSAELTRIHEEGVAYLKAVNPDLDSNPPGIGWTYRYTLTYMSFHVAYHTGQIYTARHLLGEKPPDN
jgi:hypothetical protein